MGRELFALRRGSRGRHDMLFAKNVGKRHEAGIGFAFGIHIILYGNESDPDGGIPDLKVLADFEIVPPETGDVFNNDHRSLSALFPFSAMASVSQKAGRSKAAPE